MAHAVLVCSEPGSPRARTRTRIALALAAVGLLAAPEARAASIGIDPVFTLLSCAAPACDSLTIQVSLSLGELDADSFGFDIDLDNAGILGLAIGPVPGNPIAGINGTVDLLADGTTLRGLLNSLPSSFDGIGTFDIATIPLQGVATGTAEFRFISAEIACTTCAAGAGQFYTVSNLGDGLLAQVVVVPEPGTFALVAIGLAGLGAARSSRREGSAR
jgi:hypothetical protein